MLVGTCPSGIRNARKFNEELWMQNSTNDSRSDRPLLSTSYNGSSDSSNPDHNGSTDNLNLAQNFLSTGVDPEQFGYGEPDVDENGNPYVDMYFEAEAAKLIIGAAVPAGHSARLRMYTKADQKKAVIERDTDNLTSEEMENISRKLKRPYMKDSKYGSSTHVLRDDPVKEPETFWMSGGFANRNG